MNIQEIANALNASIIEDRDGDVALLGRIYNEEGVPVVRHRPDPCDFHPVEKWEAMTAEQAAAAVC